MENVSYFENKLFRIVEKVVNLIKLNFIWLLFSIPVVTIGAANCALYEISVKIAKMKKDIFFVILPLLSNKTGKVLSEYGCSICLWERVCILILSFGITQKEIWLLQW